MTKTNKSGNVPQTIDSKGNIIPKPSGISRWASPRFYGCGHEGCEKAATIYYRGLPNEEKTHNCCTQHEHERGE